MPSALQQMSRSRPSPSVTRRVGLLSSTLRTNTSPSATTAIVLPSGESAASLTLLPTCLISRSLSASSAAVRANFSAFAPSFERSMRKRSPSTQNTAVLPSPETARPLMSSAVKSVRRLPVSGASPMRARCRLYAPVPRSERYTYWSAEIQRGMPSLPSYLVSCVKALVAGSNIHTLWLSGPL